MADKKISELNSLTGANAANGDLVAIVDVSATETKKITRSEFFKSIPSIEGGTVFNETGADVDFRIESDTNANAFFLQGSDGYVGIGTSSPASTLDVNGTITGTTGNITTVNATTVDTTNIEATNIKAKDGTASATIADSTGVMTVASSVLTTTDINGGTIDGVTIGGAVAGAGTFTSVTGTSLDLNGGAVFNESGADHDFRIESDTNTHAFFLQGSDGNVGIGTDSPTEKLHLSGTGETILVTPVAYSINQDSPYLIASGTNYNGATTNWSTYGYQHRLKTNAAGTPRVTIDTNLGEAYSVNHQSVICPNGVTLGTAAGTYNAANTLDDYEEGTWTPEYSGQSGSPTIVYDVQEGYYTKVGNVVTVTGQISTTSTTGSFSGTIRLGGLPFTCKNVTNLGAGGGLVIAAATDFVDNYPCGGYARDNVNIFTLQTRNDFTSNIFAMNNADMATGATAGNNLSFSATYLTDQ
jgi:hypothetical protein